MKKQKNEISASTPNHKKESQSEKRNKAIRLLFTLAILCLILLAIYLPLQLTGAFDKISSPEHLKQVILDFGVWGYLFFFIIQFLQVTFIPLPAVITTIAGVMVFGAWHALWISLSSILLASIFAFWLGRRFGKKIIYWIIGEKEAQKYDEKLSKGKYVFFLMMLFPIFPDDILCILAGMTKMTFKFFLITNLISRPISLASIIFFGSGMIVPFSGWGVYAWAFMLAFMGLAFYFSVKKQQQIENFIERVSSKLKRNESSEKERISTTKKM